MARNRIITLALAAIACLLAIGAALATAGGGTPTASRAPASAAPGSTAAPASSTSTSTGPVIDPVDTAVPGTGDAAPSTEPAAPTAEAPTPPRAPVHDVVPGAGGPPSANPTDPSDFIGGLDDDRPVPAGFDFVAPPKKAGGPAFGGPGGLAVAPSCSHQCITKGVAYPRGFGAEIVVEISVPARLFISVIADLDDNGDYEDVHVDSTDHFVQERTFDLDHLEPGQTYYVMAAATDEHQHTAHVWGEFTTLSHRDVTLELGTGEIVGGRDHISTTTWLLGLDSPVANVSPGDQGILLYKDRDRHAELDLWVLRFWDEKVCETWNPVGHGPYGVFTDGCVAWNSVSIDVDLDRIPVATRWTQTSFVVSVHPPTGEGNALPPGYGDPYYFSFEVPVTVHVTYR
jgi:hypothetical protein